MKKQKYYEKLYLWKKEGKAMRNNRHMEFVKSIQLLGEEKEDRNVQKMQSININNLTEAEDIDIKNNLEKRFEELFWNT